MRLHQRLLEMLNLSVIDKVAEAELRREVATMVTEILGEEQTALNAVEHKRLVEEILDEVLGLGPLEPLLKDPTVTDILFNTHAQVFVERFGKLELTPVRFKDERHLLRIIEKIVSTVGRRVDESQPWVDARLPDGSRVNAIIRPCALDGPLLSIRKFAKIPLTMGRLIEIGTLTTEMAAVLEGHRPRPAQHADLGRHRQRQDDDAERALGVHRRPGADHHDRGRRRAAAAADARRPHGDPAAQHRGQGRGHPARPRAQRAAHAARPDHRRRGARRRRRSTCSRR